VSEFGDQPIDGGQNEGFAEIPMDFDALYAENNLLRGELAALHEEYEHIQRVEIPAAKVAYLIKVGALRVELLQAQIAVMKTRRQILLFRTHIERGDFVDEVSLRHLVDIEFKEWDERLRQEAAQVEDAKARFSSLTTPEDAEEIRSVYRMLSRKINPEINPDQSEEATSLWPSVHQAYVWGDLFHLKALAIMADDYPESYDLPTNVGAMRRTRDVLHEKIAQATHRIRNAKSNSAFEWRTLLDDPVRLAEEQSKLRNEIGRIRAQHAALQDMLKSLETRSARR